MNTKDNFIQIQEVLNKITKDKGLTEQFSKLKSFEDKFNFVLDICKQNSLKSDYTIEEFKKFITITTILYELSIDKEFSEKFNQAQKVEDVYNLSIELLAKKNLDIKISKEDFETFILVASSNKKALNGNELEEISGGNWFLKRLKMLAEIQMIVKAGHDLGAELYGITHMV